LKNWIVLLVVMRIEDQYLMAPKDRHCMQLGFTAANSAAESSRCLFAIISIMKQPTKSLDSMRKLVLPPPSREIQKLISN
jgi:hypothetical protein